MPPVVLSSSEEYRLHASGCDIKLTEQRLAAQDQNEALDGEVRFVVRRDWNFAEVTDKRSQGTCGRFIRLLRSASGKPPKAGNLSVAL